MEVTRAPLINSQDKNLFLKLAEKKYNISKTETFTHNTETINNTNLNRSVIKTPNVNFTVKMSNEIETYLGYNTDKLNPKSENKQVIRKNNDTKTQKLVIILSMVIW